MGEGMVLGTGVLVGGWSLKCERKCEGMKDLVDWMAAIRTLVLSIVLLYSSSM